MWKQVHQEEKEKKLFKCNSNCEKIYERTTSMLSCKKNKKLPELFYEECKPLQLWKILPSIDLINTYFDEEDN